MFLLWCGWVIVQQPYLAKESFKPDTSSPIQEWEAATFGGIIHFFDTASECKQNAKQLVTRLSTCIPADWIKPHPWWQFWK